MVRTVLWLRTARSMPVHAGYRTMPSWHCCSLLPSPLLPGQPKSPMACWSIDYMPACGLPEGRLSLHDMGCTRISTQAFLSGSSPSSSQSLRSAGKIATVTIALLRDPFPCLPWRHRSFSERTARAPTHTLRCLETIRIGVHCSSSVPCTSSRPNADGLTLPLIRRCAVRHEERSPPLTLLLVPSADSHA
jgi:hypothetical protein